MFIRSLRALRSAAYRKIGARDIKSSGFWFVDIPRTSSSSIKSELGQKFGPAYGKKNLLEHEHATEQYFKDHIPAHVMRRIVGPKSWDRLYTFTIVRNPYDRVLSLYNYLQKSSEIPNKWTFSEFVARMVEADASTPYFHFHGLRMGAAEFITDHDGTILVDQIISYENREEGLRVVANRIGVSELGTLHIQKASPGSQMYQTAYDDITRELVADRFKTDLHLFGYSF